MQAVLLSSGMSGRNCCSSADMARVALHKAWHTLCLQTHGHCHWLILMDHLLQSASMLKLSQMFHAIQPPARTGHIAHDQGDNERKRGACTCTWADPSSSPGYERLCTAAELFSAAWPRHALTVCCFKAVMHGWSHEADDQTAIQHRAWMLPSSNNCSTEALVHISSQQIS